VAAKIISGFCIKFMKGKNPPVMHYNIRKPFWIPQIVALIFSILTILKSSAQETYDRPPVTGTWKEYERQVIADSSKQMIELKTAIPGIVYDLRYATLNNFMKRLMYPANTSVTFMRAPAVLGLQKVQAELNQKGLGLKIFDAYRPYSVTVRFWELVKDERYVAHPAKGSGHNRGIAVDLTIIDLKTGAELDMGTGFDNFSDTAHHNYLKLSEEVLQNRELLKSTMEKFGFRIFESEWWHYFLAEGEKYEILDIAFKKLKKQVK
jgi:D-alanyl-D-alanine dipeptidase